MSDVLLIKLEPEKYAKGMPPPFGILYLADALEKAGYTSSLLHLPADKNALSKIVSAVSLEKPLLVGFSNITHTPIIKAKQASTEIRRRFAVPIIWGGVHSTVFPEETLSQDFVDLVALGEGEETIVELMLAISKDGLNPALLGNIRGIGFVNNGKIRLTQPRPFIKNLDKYSPAWHNLNIDGYIRDNNFYSHIGSKIGDKDIAAVITSRGCPWRCSYCYNQKVNRRVFRSHSVERVVQEITELKKRGISAIIFEDDNFFSDKARALRIIEKIDIPWSCSIRANYLSRWGSEFVKKLRKNKCFELRIGAESGSARILRIMKKDITVDQILKSVELCTKFQIKTLLNFMVGIPGEKWSDVKQTLDLIDMIEKQSELATISSVGIYSPWPGTELYEQAITRGFRPPSSLEGWATLGEAGQRTRLAPYCDPRIKYIGFYRTLLRRDLKKLRIPFLAKGLKKIALFRWKHRAFGFAIDYHLPHLFLVILRKIGLKKIAGALYD